MTNEQTAALVKLGYNEPNNDVYLLGEALELLPKSINDFPCMINLYSNEIRYNMEARNALETQGKFFLECAKHELIDAIFDVLLLIKLIVGASSLKYKYLDRVKKNDEFSYLPNPVRTITGLVLSEGELCYEIDRILTVPIDSEVLELIPQQ